MRLLEYVPGIVAFVAALVAIVGTAKSGGRPLPRAKQINLAAAILALLASLTLTLRAQRNADFRALQQARISTLAHTELRLAIMKMIGPFRINDPSFGLVPKDALEATVRAQLAMSDLKGLATNYSPPLPMWQVFQDAAVGGSAEVDRVLQIYAPYLDSEILELTSELQRSEFLFRLRSLKEHVEDNSFIERPLPFAYSDPRPAEGREDPWGYERFWALIQKLDTALQRDEGKLRAR